MKYNALYELMEAFPDETSCVRHLEQLRWPKGIVPSQVSQIGIGSTPIVDRR